MGEFDKAFGEAVSADTNEFDASFIDDGFGDEFGEAFGTEQEKQNEFNNFVKQEEANGNMVVNKGGKYHSVPKVKTPLDPNKKEDVAFFDMMYGDRDEPNMPTPLLDKKVYKQPLSKIPQTAVASDAELLGGIFKAFFGKDRTRALAASATRPTVGVGYELLTGKEYLSKDDQELVAAHPKTAFAGTVGGGLAPYIAAGWAGLPALVSFPAISAANVGADIRTRDKDLSGLQKTGKLALGTTGGALTALIFGAAGTSPTMLGRILKSAGGAGGLTTVESVIDQAIEHRGPINFGQAAADGATTAVMIGLLTSMTEAPALKNAVMKEARYMVKRTPSIVHKRGTKARAMGRSIPVKDTSNLSYAEAKQVVKMAGIDPEKLSPIFNSNLHRQKRRQFVDSIDKEEFPIPWFMKLTNPELMTIPKSNAYNKMTRQFIKQMATTRNPTERAAIFDKWFAEASKTWVAPPDTSGLPSKQLPPNTTAVIGAQPAARVEAARKFRSAIINGADPVDIFMRDEILSQVRNKVQIEQVKTLVKKEGTDFVARDKHGNELVRAKTKAEAQRRVIEDFQNKNEFDKPWTSDSPIDPYLLNKPVGGMNLEIYPSASSDNTTVANVTVDDKGKANVQEKQEPMKNIFKDLDHERDVHAKAVKAVADLNLEYKEGNEQIKLSFASMPPELQRDIRNHIILNDTTGLSERIIELLESGNVYEYKGVPNSSATQVWVGENLFHGNAPIIDLRELRHNMEKPRYRLNSIEDLTFYGANAREIAGALMGETQRRTLEDLEQLSAESTNEVQETIAKEVGVDDETIAQDVADLEKKAQELGAPEEMPLPSKLQDSEIQEQVNAMEDTKPLAPQQVKNVGSIANPVIGDLWEQEGYKIVSTNLGGVHGRGLAAQAKMKGLIKKANKDFDSSPKEKKVITLAVKGNAPETARVKGQPYSESTTAGNVDLMEQEVDKLIEFAKQNPGERFNVPYIGLGFGEGNPTEILPILAKLDAVPNIFIISKDVTVLEKYKDTFKDGVRKDQTTAADTSEFANEFEEGDPEIQTMFQEFSGAFGVEQGDTGEDLRWQPGKFSIEEHEIELASILETLDDWHKSITAHAFKEALAIQLGNLGVITIHESTIEDEGGGDLLGRAGDVLYKKNPNFGKRPGDNPRESKSLRPGFEGTKVVKDKPLKGGEAKEAFTSEEIRLQRALDMVEADLNSPHPDFFTSTAALLKLKRALARLPDAPPYPSPNWVKPTAAEVAEDVANLQNIINKIQEYARETGAYYLEEITQMVDAIEDETLKRNIKEPLKILTSEATPEQLAGVTRTLMDYKPDETGKWKEEKWQSGPIVNYDTAPVGDKLAWHMVAANNPNFNDPGPEEKDPVTRLQPSGVERTPNGEKIDGPPLTAAMGDPRKNNSQSAEPEQALPVWMDPNNFGPWLKTHLKLAKIPIFSELFGTGTPVKGETQAEVVARMERELGVERMRKGVRLKEAEEIKKEEAQQLAMSQLNYLQFARTKGLQVEDIGKQALIDYVENVHKDLSAKQQKELVRVYGEIMQLANEEIKINYADVNGQKLSYVSISTIGMKGPWEVGRVKNVQDSEMHANIEKMQEHMQALSKLLPQTPAITDAQLIAWQAERPELFFYNLLPEDIQDILVYMKTNVEDQLFFSLIDVGLMDRTNTVANRERGFTSNHARFQEKHRKKKPTATDTPRLLEKEYRTTAEFQKGAGIETLIGKRRGNNLFVEKDYFANLGKYTEDSLNKMKQAKTIKSLVGIPNPDNPKFGYVTYAPEVEKVLGADGENAKLYLEENGYEQMHDAPGLRSFYRGGWEEPWVHGSIANVLRLYYQARAESSDFMKFFLRTKGVHKKTVMALPQLFAVQILSSPAQWLTWSQKLDLAKTFTNLSLLWGGPEKYQYGKDTRPFSDFQMDIYDLDKLESYMQHGASFFSPDWVSKALYDTPEARVHPYSKTSWGAAWDMIGGKFGMDRYVFSNVIPKTMYRYVESIERMLLAGKIPIGPFGIAKILGIPVGMEQTVDEMTPELARRIAVNLANSTSGMINDTVYGWEKDMLQAGMFARNFNVSLARQITATLLYGADKMAWAGTSVVAPFTGKPPKDHFFTSKKKLNTGGGKGKLFNSALWADTPRKDLKAVSAFTTAHLVSIITTAYFMFGMLQYGLSKLGDKLADSDPNLEHLRTKNEKDRWIYNNPIEKFGRIRTPFKDDVGKNIYLEAIFWREMINAWNVFTKPGETAVNKMDFFIRQLYENLMGETVTGETLMGRDNMEYWERRILHFVEGSLPIVVRDGPVDLDPRWRALALWSFKASTAISQGSTDAEKAQYQAMVEDEFNRRAVAIANSILRKTKTKDIFSLPDRSIESKINNMLKRRNRRAYDILKRNKARQKQLWKNKQIWAKWKKKRWQ